MYKIQTSGICDVGPIPIECTNKTLAGEDKT